MSCLCHYTNKHEVHHHIIVVVGLHTFIAFLENWPSVPHHEPPANDAHEPLASPTSCSVHIYETTDITRNSHI